MCLPMAALALAGTIVSGVGAGLGAAQQAQALSANAKAHERQAILERQKGMVDAAQKTNEINRTVGAQTAAFASNGLDVSSGSPLQVVTDTGTQGALDVASIRYGAQVRSDNEAYQGKVAESQAGLAAAAVPFAFLSPILNGAEKYKTMFK